MSYVYILKLDESLDWDEVFPGYLHDAEVSHVGAIGYVLHGLSPSFLVN